MDEAEGAQGETGRQTEVLPHVGRRWQIGGRATYRESHFSAQTASTGPRRVVQSSAGIHLLREGHCPPHEAHRHALQAQIPLHSAAVQLPAISTGLRSIRPRALCALFGSLPVSARQEDASDHSTRRSGASVTQTQRFAAVPHRLFHDIQGSPRPGSHHQPRSYGTVLALWL